MTHGFRLRFLLAPGRRLNSGDETLVLRTSDHSEFQMKPVKGGAIGDANNLVIRGSGYKDEEIAWAAGQRVKDAVLLASVTTNLGVDLGRNRQTSGLGRKIREEIREKHGVDLLGDVHGLAVFSEDRETKFFSSQATITVGTQAAKFQEAFNEHYEYATAATSRHRLAAELIGLAHFEPHVRARFLTLMTALEVLSVQKRLGKKYQEAISSLIEHAEEQEFSPEVLKVLKNGLGRLRRQSLTAACSDLVAKNLGNEYGDEIQSLYNIRSKIVHEGAGISTDEIDPHLPKLWQIATETLVADLKKKDNRAD